MSSQPVLVADIGGTHARFALADPTRPAPLLDDSIDQQPVGGHATLADAARAYLYGRNVNVHRAVFAVAGPVREGPGHDDVVRMTNHPWEISSTGLCEALGLDQALLVNDFAAQAMAIPLLSDKDRLDLCTPTPPTHARAIRSHVILGPGTGLGVAALLHRDGHDIAVPTEGGHLGFAPRTPDEAAVLQYLAASCGRVSNERLVSGGGLVNLHRALRAMSGQAASGDAGDTELTPQQITGAATIGDPCCKRAVTMFCDILGAIAGDLVLAYGAWDGAYLSGGMLQYLLPALRQSDALHRFRDKGRYADLLARVPLRVVLHPQPGLLGAAAMARSMTGRT